MHDFYVYVYFDMCGIPRYVGKGRGSRWNVHLHSSSHKNPRFKALVAEHGKNLPRIKVREGLSEADAFVTEVALIDAIGRDDMGAGPLFNMTDGGEGISGSKRSAEATAAAVAKIRGQKRTAEQRENMRQAQLGTVQSDEWIAKRVTGRAGYKHSDETKQKIGRGNKGKVRAPISEETRVKLSAASKRNSFSEEARRRARESKIGKKRPPFSAEHRAKTSATLKALFAAKRARALKEVKVA